jgi:hypothetical protein
LIVDNKFLSIGFPIVSTRNVDSERSGEGSSQDLSAAAGATALITEKSSESQNADM